MDQKIEVASAGLGLDGLSQHDLLIHLAKLHVPDFEVVSRHRQILFAREKLLQGYSPQISHRSASIDWNRTMENISKSEIEFVRTPDFMLEHVRGGIFIRIIKPGEVTTDEMSKHVEKAYGRIREKVFDGRRGWGVVSRSKAFYQERNKEAIEYYKRSCLQLSRWQTH